MDMERVIQEAYDNGYLRGYEKGKADTEECACCEYRVGDECCYSDVDVKADRPKGEMKSMGTYYKCSVCGSEFMDEITFMGELNYCPACGADMREREGE